jgi:hypothetical protein
VRPLVDAVPAFRRICEAVEAARHSVWLTVTFYAPDFQMPDGRGALFDVLDRAVERGLDVRVIFWRANQESIGYGRTFAGTPDERDLLKARGSRFRIRWDRAPGRYCHHQKSWLIDAGQASETAFVGGMNLTARAMGSPGHGMEGERHDVYVEITGPSASDAGWAKPPGAQRAFGCVPTIQSPHPNNDGGHGARAPLPTLPLSRFHCSRRQPRHHVALEGVADRGGRQGVNEPGGHQQFPW